MSILKKKYNYIQRYTHNVDLKSGMNTPVGFYTGSNLHNDRIVTDLLWMQSLFPHYGFSMYDHPPGKIISPKKERIPALYLSDLTINFGVHSFCNITKLMSICKDDVSPKYKDYSLHMYMGSYDKINPDIQFLLNSMQQTDLIPDTNPVKDISILSNDLQGNTTGDIPHEEVRQNLAIYEALRNISLQDTNDYLDFIYLTSDIPISLELSYPTIRNIIKTNGSDLSPLYQISCCDENYHQIFSKVFYSDDKKVLKADINNKSYPLRGVLPGIYGHIEGAIFNLSSGTVTGKRKELAAFLLFLNTKGILERKDLEYLI